MAGDPKFLQKMMARGSSLPTITPRLLKKMLDLPPNPMTVKEQLRGMSEAGAAAESAGIVILRANYAFQSFYSSTLIEQALLTQAVAEPIVRSTLKLEETAGYGVALYPASESPVAVQLLLGGGKSGSAAIVLKPGDAYVSQQRFDGIRWGLPFGWLGGGAVQLRILQERDDVLFLPSVPEIVFQRIRLPVWSVTANPAAAGRGVSPNWPRRFPWPNSIDLNGNPQKGQPSVAVTPTKTIFRLRRTAPLLQTARMRLLIVQSDDLDLGSDGATLDAINASGTWIDVQWPAIGATGFQIGGVATAEFPSLTLDAGTSRTGGDNAIALLIDADGTLGATVALGTTLMCDVERFGTL
jgi:hypothetical protein